MLNTAPDTGEDLFFMHMASFQVLGAQSEDLWTRPISHLISNSCFIVPQRRPMPFYDTNDQKMLFITTSETIDTHPRAEHCLVERILLLMILKALDPPLC